MMYCLVGSEMCIRDSIKGFGSIKPFQLVPLILLAAVFDPAFEIFGVHCSLGVVVFGLPELPALLNQPVDDVLLKVLFLMR